MAGAVCLAVGFLQGTGSGREVWWAAGLPCLLTAVGWRVWTAPEEGLADALRLRRLSRRIALRLGTVPALVAAVALPLGSGAWAVWAALLTPVPLLVETALWQFAPAALRRNVRAGRVLEEAQVLAARAGQDQPQEFDPTGGRSGRLVPDRFLPAPGGFRAACSARPSRRRIQETQGVKELIPEDELWLRSAYVQWSSSRRVLVLCCGPAGTVRVPLDPATSPSLLGGPLADVPVELVWLKERYRYAEEVRILLLNARSQRLLTMPGLGMRQTEVARVAQAAGLAYSAYELRQPDVLPAVELPWHNLPNLMFPRHRRHVQPKLTRHQLKLLDTAVEMKLPPARWPAMVGQAGRS
ncbi:hypothetical protein [Streptacidiphilus fuscans]|uniref:Uncharacterized protein n=1 Tax=Streptacidiphilus fuscans TaxID=2789292 RepID=A0A931FBM1_9ACTN|nr:hypothetical protein [Streptacidiphilus fuscans]MBF9068807.1 hypothetical protein [Streptacidiphilus fuscans]